MKKTTRKNGGAPLFLKVFLPKPSHNNPERLNHNNPEKTLKNPEHAHTHTHVKAVSMTGKADGLRHFETHSVSMIGSARPGVLGFKA